jgi:hypothetical protein
VNQRTVVGLSLGAIVGVVSIGLAAAGALPPRSSKVSQASGNPLDEKGFEMLPAPIWSKDRLRECSLLAVGEAPKYAGQVITATLEVSRGAALMTAWHFYDSAGQLALHQQGSSCFTNVKVKQAAGNYRFDFTLPETEVAFDPAVNAAASSNPAFHACREVHLEKPASPVVVSIVVEEDDSIFVSAGTRNVDNLRDCLGKTLAAWAEPQLAAGTFPLTRPAVVTATLPVVPVVFLPTPGPAPAPDAPAAP